MSPAFPFGHGLSYSEFKYGDLVVTRVNTTATTVKFSLGNVGMVGGSPAAAEVAQVYLAFPSAAGEPPKQLKGFEKVFLDTNDSKQVVITLRDRDFSTWDVTTHSWQVVHGTFTVMVGSSSRDIRLTQTIDVP